MCLLPMMCPQAPNLVAMVRMSGTGKKDACDILHAFKRQIGQVGLKQIMECEGDFPAAFETATAFCATGSAPDDTSQAGRDSDEAEKMCIVANAQVRLHELLYLCTAHSDLQIGELEQGFGKVGPVGTLSNHCVSF